MTALDISQGEWIFSERPDSESADAGIVAGDHIIATIHHITRIGPAPDFGVTWGHYGDGYLMAAAPDLLAACEAYIAAEDGTDLMTAFVGMTRARALMDRAIAKAKGNDDA